MIPYGRQDISQADIDAVTAVLKSDFLTQGPAVPEFEAALCAATGAAHALAMNSATSALHVACAALGLGPGDWLWTSPISFVASANCGLYCGAQVDFVDIDPKSFNMCPEALARKLEQAERDGTLPKVIVPVHLCGQSCDMERIGGLARRYGVKVIEDASHAIGGSYQGLPVGAGTYSDIVVLSFHPVKIVTTAEGGAALTNDPELAHRMGLLRSHGITRDPARMTHESDEHADAYDAALAPLPLTTPWRQPETRSALHLYVVQVDAARRRAVFEGLRARGVGVNVHYIPIHLQPHYRAMGFSQGDFPAAEAYYARAISLPMFPTLSAEDRHYVVTSLAQELGA